MAAGDPIEYGVPLLCLARAKRTSEGAHCTHSINQPNPFSALRNKVADISLRNNKIKVASDSQSVE